MSNESQAPAGAIIRHDDFASEILGNRRSLFVYLPPGYDDAGSRRYPVLYLHDGQNLFDGATAAFGVAWDAHATADRLIYAGLIPPLIMVGVANTPTRIDEYALYRDRRRRAGGRGRLYGRFLVEEVKPFIDRTYRTRRGRETTGVAGSSMGGLASLTIAWEFAEVFSLCAILSPSLWWCRGRVLRELRRDPEWLGGGRFWVDMGTREGTNGASDPAGVQRTRQLVRLFDAAGLSPGYDYAYREVAGGRHNEAAWAARFDQVLLFLFGTRRWRDS